MGKADQREGEQPPETPPDRPRTQPRVLVVEPGTILGELYELWLAEDYHVETAASESDVVDTIDHSIGVAVLAPSVPEQVAERVVSVVLDSYPHCLVVDVAPRSGDGNDIDVDVDEQLQDPIDGETLRDTVRTQLRRAEYGATLYRHVRLATLVTARETQLSEDALADDEQYARLTQELAAEREHLERLTERLDEEDVAAWVDSFEIRKEHVRRADPDTEPGVWGPKYLPHACPACGLQWGVKHGDDLGLGYTRLGSHIYKCRECDEVVKNDGGGQQRVPW